MHRPFLLFSSLAALAALAACGSSLDVGSTGHPDDGTTAAPPAASTPGAATPPPPCPAANGKSEILAASEVGRFIDGLTVDGDDVYYASLPLTGMGDSPIMRVSVSGGAPVEVGRTPRPMALAVSGEWIYVTPAGNSNYELLRLKKTGGAVETIALDPDESPVRVVADGSGGIVYAGLRANAGVAPLVRIAADGTRTKLATSTAEVGSPGTELEFAL